MSDQGRTSKFRYLERCTSWLEVHLCLRRFSISSEETVWKYAKKNAAQFTNDCKSMLMTLLSMHAAFALQMRFGKINGGGR